MNKPYEPEIASNEDYPRPSKLPLDAVLLANISDKVKLLKDLVDCGLNPDETNRHHQENLDYIKRIADYHNESMDPYTKRYWELYRKE